MIIGGILSILRLLDDIDISGILTKSNFEDELELFMRLRILKTLIEYSKSLDMK